MLRPFEILFLLFAVFGRVADAEPHQLTTPVTTSRPEKTIENTSVVYWTLYDNRWDFIEFPALVKNLCGVDKSTGLLCHKPVPIDNIFEVAVHAPLNDQRNRPWEQKESDPSFESQLWAALQKLEKAENPELVIVLKSHGTSDEICRQKRTAVRHEEFVSTVLDTVDTFTDRGNLLPRIVLFIDTCGSMGITNAFRKRAQKSQGGFANDEGDHFKYKIDLFTSAKDDGYSYANDLTKSIIRSADDQHGEQIGVVEWESAFDSSEKWSAFIENKGIDGSPITHRDQKWQLDRYKNNYHRIWSSHQSVAEKMLQSLESSKRLSSSRYGAMRYFREDARSIRKQRRDLVPDVISALIAIAENGERLDSQRAFETLTEYASDISPKQVERILSLATLGLYEDSEYGLYFQTTRLIRSLPKQDKLLDREKSRLLLQRVIYAPSKQNESVLEALLGLRTYKSEIPEYAFKFLRNKLESKKGKDANTRDVAALLLWEVKKDTEAAKHIREREGFTSVVDTEARKAFAKAYEEVK